VIVQLAWEPCSENLRIASSAEDFVVKIWDLVLNKDIAALKGS